MAFLFNRNRQRGNAELCRSSKELFQRINSDEPRQPRVEEDLARNLTQMKLILQGTTEQEASPQQAFQLIEYLLTEDLLWPLAVSVPRLPFESRKDAQVIFSNVFRFRTPPPAPNSHLRGASSAGASDQPMVMRHIIDERPDIIVALCRGYDHRESAMPCGGVLREALKHDTIAALVLYDEPMPDGRSRGLNNLNPDEPSSGKGVFWNFFDWIDKSAFEVSADAFNTFREILTKHKRLLAHWLLVNQPLFLQRYTGTLVQSASYVTKRQSIKLLGELLLERSNYTFMTNFAESASNLKLAMNLLRDDRRMVNYESFHIFKIFVANPEKSPEVRRLLVMNRERLLKFLPGFLDDRSDDVQFADEKAYCIRLIEALPTANSTPERAGSGGQSQQEQSAQSPNPGGHRGGPGGIQV